MDDQPRYKCLSTMSIQTNPKNWDVFIQSWLLFHIQLNTKSHRFHLLHNLSNLPILLPCSTTVKNYQGKFLCLLLCILSNILETKWWLHHHCTLIYFRVFMFNSWWSPSLSKWFCSVLLRRRAYSSYLLALRFFPPSPNTTSKLNIA